MRSILQTLSSKIDKISRYIIVVLFTLAFIGTVYQVFSRFILQSSLIKDILPMVDFNIFNLTWMEEFIRYLFVWIVFLGIGIVYKGSGHARVELFISYLSEKWRVRVECIIEVLNLALFVFLIAFGSSILKFTSQQVSPSMEINMTLIYMSVLISSIICLVHSVTQLVNLTSAKTRSEDIKVKTSTNNTNIG